MANIALEKLDEIRNRVEALGVAEKSWYNAIVFAIDAPLLNDVRFSAQLDLIRNAPADLRDLLDMVWECLDVKKEQAQ